MREATSTNNLDHIRDFRPPTLSAVCSYCKRVRTAAGHWCHPDSIDEDITHLTHSACPSCYGIAVIAMLEEIREELGRTIQPERERA